MAGSHISHTILVMELTSGYTDTTWNFGQRAFAYPLSGFKALCTTNLPEPTIADGSTAMDVKLYTGNGSTQTISGLNFSPDFLWIKRRNTALDHFVWDSVRGITKELYTNQNYAEGTATNKLTSLNSNGFTVQNNAAVNALNDTYVAWTWDAGSSTVTNTEGSITSQVRANASAGFSVITWTGTGSTASYGHGLGVAPIFYITKNRTSTADWMVKTTAIDGSLDFLSLNLTNAKGDSSVSLPTSTVINLFTGIAAENASGASYVTYAFAPVAGYSAMGSYVGNGSSDGPMVYTGFRIKWLLLKNTTSSGDMWFLLDSSRDPENPNTLLLQPNTSDQELDNATNYSTDLLSNGFKLRSSTSRNNSSGNTFIYIAFAENPLKTARAR
jgi:hypothetical protein